MNNSSTKSIKERLGSSETKKSILSRIGNSNRSGTVSRISSALKNRLQPRQNTSPNIVKRLDPVRRTPKDFIQNKLLFKRAIEESTSADRPVTSISRFRKKKSIEAEDRPINFRIPNGMVVKGLRSDSILLNKKRTGSASTSRAERPTSRIEIPSRKRFSDTGKAIMSLERELTVSIKNDQIKRHLQNDNYRPERKIQNECESSDGEYMSEESYPLMPTVSPLKHDFRKRNIQQYVRPQERNIQSYMRPEEMDMSYLRPMMSKIVVMPTPELIPVPQVKLHKQVLDSGIQSEIAALQGYEASGNSGPGQGVKSFKMIPVITAKPLTDRFKQEKETN